MKGKTTIAAIGILALIVVFAALSGGLGSLELPAGRPLPPPSVEERSDRPLLPSAGGAFPHSTLDIFVIFLPIFLVFILGGTIASIRSRRFRYELGLSLFAFAVLVLFYSIAGMIHTTETSAPPPDLSLVATGVRGGWGGEGAIAPIAPTPAPPAGARWRIPLLIGLAAVLLLFSGAFLIGRARARIAREGKSSAGLGEIAEWAADAAARIRSGEEIAGVVQRCYARMAEILSRRSEIDPTYLTPREFARSLKRAGMADEHVERLTAMFELVRYGSRPDARFAERAVACLDAIREAYATPC